MHPDVATFNGWWSEARWEEGVQWKKEGRQLNHYCYCTVKMEIGSVTNGKGYQGQTQSNTEMGSLNGRPVWVNETKEGSNINIDGGHKSGTGMRQRASKTMAKSTIKVWPEDKSPGVAMVNGWDGAITMCGEIVLRELINMDLGRVGQQSDRKLKGKVLKGMRRGEGWTVNNRLGPGSQCRDSDTQVRPWQLEESWESEVNQTQSANNQNCSLEA